MEWHREQLTTSSGENYEQTKQCRRRSAPHEIGGNVFSEPAPGRNGGEEPLNRGAFKIKGFPGVPAGVVPSNTAWADLLPRPYEEGEPHTKRPHLSPVRFHHF